MGVSTDGVLERGLSSRGIAIAVTRSSHCRGANHPRDPGQNRTGANRYSPRKIAVNLMPRAVGNPSRFASLF